MLADGSVVGDLKIGGTLTSKACDNVMGAKGTITEAQLWVNGAETPQASITVQASKGGSGTRARPYPYTGTIQAGTVIPNVPLTAGVNTFKFTAHDPVYGMPGYSTWAATVTVTDPTEEDDGGGGGVVVAGLPASLEGLTLSVALPAATLSATVAETVSATFTADGAAATGLSLVETAAASGVFTATLADGRPARLSLVNVAALSATAADSLAATLLVGEPGTARAYGTLVAESAPASGLFSGSRVTSSGGGTVIAGGSTTGSGSTGGGATGTNPTNTDGSNGNTGGTVAGAATPVVSLSSDPYQGMQEVEKSNGGEFHHYAISVGVPEALKQHFQMAFDGETFELMKDQASGLMVLKTPGQSQETPLSVSFKPGETAPSESAVEHAKRMEDMKDVSFAKGFACGVGHGTSDMVTSTGKFIVGAADFVGRGYAGIGLGFTWVAQWMRSEDTFDTETMIIEIGAPTTQVVDQGVALAEFLEPLITAPVTMLPKIAWGFYTGDEQLVNSALYGSESHRIIFQMACEAILETKKDWENGTDGQKGYITGRILFEVAGIVIPAGAAGRAVSKLEVLAHLRQTGLFKQGARAVMAAKEAALAVTKMCFEAGTKVRTQGEERVLIQDVQAEQKVWSRDELTGEESLKRVVQTFTTHPRKLYRLTYEVRGPPEGGPLSPRAESETLGVTAPHPFWVCNNEPPGFIAAEDLRVGDVLFIGEGREAVVTRKVLEQAPPGETFTTYNFEVEDFHTYFVGDAGVWVHNMSKSPCDEVFDLVQLLKTEKNMPSWEAFKVAVHELGKGRNTSIFGWAADETMRDLLKLPLPERAAQWPSHREVRRVMDKAMGKPGTVNVSDLKLGRIDVPDWVVQQRLDMADVKSFMLESNHGIPKYMQGWLGITKDVDGCPAFLSTMLEHRGAGHGFHQRLDEELARQLGRPVPSNRPRPPDLTDSMILDALSETYRKAGLQDFWKVCLIWKNAP